MELEQKSSNPAALLASLMTSKLGLALSTDLTFKSFKDNIKPWRAFFNPADFSKPAKSEIFMRVQDNLVYFASNYVILMVLFVLIGILSSPSFLISLLVLGAVWGYLYSVKSLVISGQEITNFQKNLGMLAVTALVTIVMAGSLICSIIGLSAVLAILHAGLHNTSVPQLVLDNDIKV